MILVLLFKVPPRKVFTLLDMNESSSTDKDIDWGGKEGKHSGNDWILAEGKSHLRELSIDWNQKSKNLLGLNTNDLAKGWPSRPK